VLSDIITIHGASTGEDGVMTAELFCNAAVAAGLLVFKPVVNSKSKKRQHTSPFVQMLLMESASATRQRLQAVQQGYRMAKAEVAGIAERIPAVRDTSSFEDFHAHSSRLDFFLEEGKDADAATISFVIISNVVRWAFRCPSSFTLADYSRSSFPHCMLFVLSLSLRSSHSRRRRNTRRATVVETLPMWVVRAAA
jgi:hypothetical protein